MTRRILLLLAALLPVLASAEPADKTFDRIRSSKTIRLAYRTDAPPFSFEKEGQPAGYSVDLCKRVVASLEQQLKVASLKVKWVPADVRTRLNLVRKGEVDLECGTTTASLSRMGEVDFSNPIWVDVTGIISRKSVGARALSDLAGKNIAAVEGTPNQQALMDALRKGLVSATVVPARSYEDAIALLEDGKADAIAAGKTMLMGMGPKLKDPSIYELMDADIGYVPYALVMPLGSTRLRQAVNRALSQIYASDALVEVFRGTFGPTSKPAGALMLMYQLNIYPE
ncbi:MAG: amino acid ABC transporter substrate-binding protein [Anaeromyxobacter sp.]